METLDRSGLAQECWVLGPLARRYLQAQPAVRLRLWHGIQFDAGDSGKDGPKVRTILVSSTLFLTIILSVFLGVISAYGAIQGILQVFAQQPRPLPQPEEEPLPALVAQEAAVQQ